MWPWRVELSLGMGRGGPADLWLCSCWLGLVSGCKDELSPSPWSELKPGLSRASFPFRRLICQHFVASCVYISHREVLGHTASSPPWEGVLDVSVEVRPPGAASA